MKTKLLFLLPMLAVLFAACEKKNDSMSEEENVSVETVSATNITSNSALLTGRIVTEIVDYKPIDFGIIIAKSESSVASHDGLWLSGDKLLGQTFSITANHLSIGTTYYYCAYVAVRDHYEMPYKFGDIKSFKTEEPSGARGKEGNYEWVDLGLSVKWATCNVGATNPEDYGDYFAWGETTPKTCYDWNTYKWCTYTGNPRKVYITKYFIYADFTKGNVDNKATLDPTDDAAHVNWGGTWRMPTYKEQCELHENCNWTWTESYNNTGIKGYIVKSKKNSNSIFLPVAGYYDGPSPFLVGSEGGYWSSLLYDESIYAYYLDVRANFVDLNKFSRRYCGFSIRPVCK